MSQNIRMTIRCSQEQWERLKSKAKKLHISLNTYLLHRGLEDERMKDFELRSLLAKTYVEVCRLNQYLHAQEPTESVQEAIALWQKVGLELLKLRGQSNHAN